MLLCCSSERWVLERLGSISLDAVTSLACSCGWRLGTRVELVVVIFRWLRLIASSTAIALVAILGVASTTTYTYSLAVNHMSSSLQRWQLFLSVLFCVLCSSLFSLSLSVYLGVKGATVAGLLDLEDASHPRHDLVRGGVGGLVQVYDTVSAQRKTHVTRTQSDTQ